MESNPANDSMSKGGDQDLKDRMAQMEFMLKSHGDLIEKKLSKHEFNGFKQVMDSLKEMFNKQFAKVEAAASKQETSTKENTVALMAVQTTFNDVKLFLPILIKVIVAFGSVIIGISVFVGSKVIGWW